MSMKEPDKISAAADRLRASCSRREYCSSEVMKKALKLLDGNQDGAGKVLAMLMEEGYVDDARYAGAFCRDKASLAGWGEVKIRYMLRAKGLSQSTIDQALEEVDVEKASDRLERLLSTKLRSLKKDDPQIRLKLIRYALGRGYSYDRVSDLTDRLLNTEQ